MNFDWAADVRKYAPYADGDVIAAIAQYCRTEPMPAAYAEVTGTVQVREQFLKHKLGLMWADADLDHAIDDVRRRMAGDFLRNRVTVYYLLAERFNCLHVFQVHHGHTETAPAEHGADHAEPEQVWHEEVPHEEPMHDEVPHEHVVHEVHEFVPEPATFAEAGIGAALIAETLTHQPAHPVYEPVEEPADMPRGSLAWLLWLLLGLLLLGLLLWMVGCQPHPAGNVQPVASAAASDSAAAEDDSSEAATAAAAVPGAPATPAAAVPGAPATPTTAPIAMMAAPEAGVITETRDGKPAVKVYFRTGSAWLVSAFRPAAQSLKAYLADHAGATLAVSGFADKTGSPDINAVIAKERASRVKAALVAAGIPDASVALIKPADVVDSSDTNGNGRRVDVTVK